MEMEDGCGPLEYGYMSEQGQLDRSASACRVPVEVKKGENTNIKPCTKLFHS